MFTIRREFEKYATLIDLSNLSEKVEQLELIPPPVDTSIFTKELKKLNGKFETMVNEEKLTNLAKKIESKCTKLDQKNHYSLGQVQSLKVENTELFEKID